MFYIRMRVTHKNEVCVISKALIVWLETGTNGAWGTIFDISILLKTMILPLRLILWNHQSFNTVYTLETILRKWHYFLLLRDCIRKKYQKFS